MIRGMHAMFYCSHADDLRAFLRDKLGFKAHDVGDGWLIFDAPEADLGVHPSEEGDKDAASGTAHLSFYCDDIARTKRDLEGRGVEFTQEVQDHGYGLVTFFRVPGGFSVQLYQPKYKKGKLKAKAARPRKAPVRTTRAKAAGTKRKKKQIRRR